MRIPFVLLCLLAGTSATSHAQDWDANDDSFDPTIHSVVIGDASWLGDPSPFVHLQSTRTGYTHVGQVNWDGFEPSVQLSLMVPKLPTEEAPPAGGMLLMDKAQSLQFIKMFQEALNSESKEDTKPTQIKTSMKDAMWALRQSKADGSRFIDLENKEADKVVAYRFTINASRKLLQAFEHSFKKLEAKEAE